MQSVRQKDTGPEMTIRRELHRRGYRFRVHKKGLPGRPDIVFPARKKVIFVHGCFWHGHDCSKGRLPKIRNEYWKPKIDSNKARDERTINELKSIGWESLVVWQCEIKSFEQVLGNIVTFLGSPNQG
jgi:DNA mismatch endonuclease (patch repair protein)